MSKFVSPASEQLAYMGRIDFTKPERPVFYYAASSVTLKFRGTEIRVRLNNKKMWGIISVGYILDGKEGKAFIEVNDRDIIVTLAENLDDETHEITLFKRQDSTHYFELLGFELNDGAQLLDKKILPARKIECYGDSVSAGAVCEAIDYTGKCDPENNEAAFDNAWHSYASITARNLGAQLHDIAQGGIAIFDDSGYYHAPDYIGMESVYDKLCYMPEGRDGLSDWDFTKYVPNVVLFAVGQNDPHHEGHEDNNILDKDYRQKWKDGYKKIILDLRAKYPDATFVLLLTVLCHGKEWDDVIEEIAGELDDEKITYLKFTRAGKATPGHPRLSEQYEMAGELTAYLSNMGDKIWD